MPYPTRLALRRWVEKDYTFEQRNKIIHSEQGVSDTAWATLAELGMIALPIPEEQGGFNGTAVDMMVVMQELGPHPDSAAHCGEVLATIFSRLGAVGLVSDCAVRDIPEVRALHFRYFARGAAASHANYRIVRVGVPVQVLGLAVQAQGLLHGDENGLITVPDATIESLQAAVTSVRSHERALMDFVRTPGFTVEQLRGRFLH